MKGKHKLPETFPITPAMRSWAEQKVGTLDIDYYHDEFLDHWNGNGKMMADWQATWRNWMRRTDNGSAPGVRRDQVRRKRPRPLPTQGNLVESDVWSRIDALRNRAVAGGMTMIEARQLSPQELVELFG